ncbi:TPA: type VI secretion system tip protein VgrG [Enterobacter hormaechei subsp. steigerwaltii]|nr:type VI secretion system tip protein VgrG [Enterobacter hormaechei subsp. steigerwaltii]
MERDNWLALFDGQTRYTLDINDSRVNADVLSFRGREALNVPFHWRIEFTTPQRDIGAKDVLLKYATLRMRSGKVVHGVIAGFQTLGTTADQSRYSVTLSSRLALMAHTRRCAVYQNLSVPELVEQVLRQHGLEGADFTFRLDRQYPPRELITQWRETDLQFIQRLVAEVGIWFHTGVNDDTGLDTVTFADSQQFYQFDQSLPYREPSALHDGAVEAVWDARVWYNTATGRVQARDYNYRRAGTPMNALSEISSAAVTTGEHYRYVSPFTEAGDDTTSEPETESGAFYARIHHERELNNATRIHLFSNASGLAPGQVLDMPGAGMAALQDGMVITQVTFRAARDTRLHVSVQGMPYSERVCFRPADISRPVISGTLPARVESRDAHDMYAHLDSTGRYRVKLDFSREDVEPGYNYLWIRQAKPYAGRTYGWYTPLIDGTEVSIAWDGGDPDRPYIAHAFHDSEHADVVTRDNRSQNILRTAGTNELRMEDKREEEHIHLSTPFGKSQLSQGHIVGQDEQPRGTGFELRTDEFGVIRVAKGLFITSDGQTKAAGEVLDMQTVLREIEDTQNRIRQLAEAARQADALQADIASQQQMFSQRLKPLNETMHFSAPQGMAFTSGEHLQLAASDNLAINAAGDISTGSLGNTTLLAGHTLGLFARTGDLEVIAGEGPLEMQAQNAQMQLSAEQAINILSDSDILFAAKKRIVLIGGGSYLKIEGGSIEYGSADTYTGKIPHNNSDAGAKQQPEMPYLPGDGKYDLALNFHDGLAPIANAPYVVHFEGGSQLSGVLDEQGYALHKNVPFESATVEYQLPPPEPEKPWDPWSSLLAKTQSREA